MLMKRFLQLAVALCITICAHAQFSGSGSGTESDPYLIFNPIQLDQVRNFLGKTGVYFKMMADIDLTQFIQDNYPTQGWLPIGNSSSAFKGEFDGNGKKITNMTINRPTTDYLGLFGNVHAATIKNLTIQGEIKGQNHIGGAVGSVKVASTITNVTTYVNISGSSYIGGVAGSAYLSTISNIKTHLTANGTDHIGGIVGYVQSESDYNSYRTKITEVEVDVTINGKNNLGGVVGHNSNGGDYGYTYINYSIVTCTINGTDFCGGIIGNVVGDDNGSTVIGKNYVGGTIIATNYVGGIGGYIESGNPGGRLTDPVIFDNYFVGTLIGKQYVGGVCGYVLGGRVNLCRNYSNATITGTTEVGGVVGYLGSRCAKSNVAINEYVSGTSNVGRIYGSKSSSATIGTNGTAETNKALTTTKVIVNSIQQIVDDTEQHGQSVGKTMLQYKATYQGIGWDFSSTWNMQETETYPYLAFQSAPPVIDATTALSGSKQLKGNGTANAKIYVEIGGHKSD